MNLTQAMKFDAEGVRAQRRECDKKFGPGLFDRAVAHHVRLRLRANIQRGTTSDNTGWRSGFVGYDWAQTYIDNPSHVYFDFFSGAIGNSVSRMARGLQP